MPPESESQSQYPRLMRRVTPALGLFFLAPLVGEFLLGNLPITFLPALLLLAPLYGGGALLIRETSRRFGLTWPGMLVLGVTFGIIEEAFVTQSLFNPNYLGMRLLDYGYIPALGISTWWTVFVLTLHTIWSTAVPIAVTETLTPSRRRAPWLGRVGLSVTAAVFVIGCALLAVGEIKKGFVATPAQFIGSAIAIVVLVTIAFIVRRARDRKESSSTETHPSSAPSPFAVGATAFAVGGVFFALVRAKQYLSPTVDVLATVAMLGAAAALVLRWSKRAGWSESHRLGLTAGFMLTYAWYGFVQIPSVGNVSPTVDFVGNVIFVAGAVALLAAAVHRVRSEKTRA